MKRALAVFVLIWALQSVCLAASVKQLPDGAAADLREYQQSVGTLNVMTAPFDGVPMYVAAFNFDQQKADDKTEFYRGIGILPQGSADKLHILLVKKVIGSADSFAEQLVNKDGTTVYKQSLRAVQTDSAVPVAYFGGDADKMVYMGRFAVQTAAGSFDDCIGIKIYNDKTHEGMVQYLAKGCGIIYLEGVRADGSAVAIAELHEIQPLSDEQAKLYKQQYFSL